MCEIKPLHVFCVYLFAKGIFFWMGRRIYNPYNETPTLKGLTMTKETVQVVEDEVTPVDKKKLVIKLALIAAATVASGVAGAYLNQKISDHYSK